MEERIDKEYSILNGFAHDENKVILKEIFKVLNKNEIKSCNSIMYILKEAIDIAPYITTI